MKKTHYKLNSTVCCKPVQQQRLCCNNTCTLHDDVMLLARLQAEQDTHWKSMWYCVYTHHSPRSHWSIL